MTIRFGTSGWRGILAEDFDFAGVRALASAVALWVAESGIRPRVVVAHDTRFMGDRFARVAARVPRLLSQRLRSGARLLARAARQGGRGS